MSVVFITICSELTPLCNVVICLVKLFVICYLFLVNVAEAECGCGVFSSLPAGLPDPFAKVVVDGSGQCHSTDTVRNTLDPKWNQHYDL